MVAARDATGVVASQYKMRRMQLIYDIIWLESSTLPQRRCALVVDRYITIFVISLMWFVVVSMFGQSPRAEIFKCIYTEPFITTIYSTNTNTLTITDASNQQNSDTLTNVSLQIMEANIFELWTADKAAVQRMELNFRGGDGMSDSVYPYDSTLYKRHLHPNLRGGCTSNHLNIQDEERKSVSHTTGTNDDNGPARQITVAPGPLCNTVEPLIGNSSSVTVYDRMMGKEIFRIESGSKVSVCGHEIRGWLQISFSNVDGHDFTGWVQSKFVR